MVEIDEKLEKIREKLNQALENKSNNFENILEVSRELDVLVLEYQKKLNKD